ncbi:MAG TPA: hypothetical protein VHL08_06190 [Dongiaceae bacterium]|jgi:hypothetical protein|nr:hypothetical protein [Dongiaceae bacterium]
MGQYHLIVNPDRQEFLDPHQFGVDLKAWEQITNHPGILASPVRFAALFQRTRCTCDGGINNMYGARCLLHR